MEMTQVNGIKSVERLPNGDVLIEALTTDRKPKDRLVLRIDKHAMNDITRELQLQPRQEASQ